MAEETIGETTEKKPMTKRQLAGKICAICGFALACVLLAALTINALLCVFVKHYYPTFGQHRLFAIVSDSMEPEIMTGDMVVGRVPKDESEITIGTVITYELEQNGSIVLITHRVIDVGTNATTGETYYITRGDNAGGTDAYRPVFSDIVGIYTGNKCGFFGYFFGFLQSPEGAIALIIIILIIAITLIIVHFVNLVTIWRKIALSALRKSGMLLSETQIEELGTIADVIGIVTKEPLDKTDIRRKDKKLHWFIRTGALPKRPYSDDLDENAAQTVSELASIPKLDYAREDERDGTDEQAIASADEAKTVEENNETMTYRYTYTAKLIQMAPQSKEWYSKIKNELLSYKKVRLLNGKQCETFMFGKKTVARIIVRGKTLCLQLALEPEELADTKIKAEKGSSNTPVQYRIKSELRSRNALTLIARTMEKVNAVKDTDYVPQDFYKPYEGVVTLMRKGLVSRNVKQLKKLYRIMESDGGEECVPVAEEPERPFGKTVSPQPAEPKRDEDEASDGKGSNSEE